MRPPMSQSSWRTPRHHAPNNGLSFLRWSRAEQTLAVAAGLGFICLGLFAWGYEGTEALLALSTNLLPFPTTNDQGSYLVDLKIVKGAEAKGAVCLDGSPPAYYFQRGTGSGAQNWLVFLQGGGWCHTKELCAKRSWTPLGSSSKMNKRMVFQGILNNSSALNPDFYNWNIAMVAYCDGASFAGDKTSTVNYRGRELHFRGERVWNAVMDELVDAGMGSASQALLAGCSAGGLATMLHCDRFKERLPRTNVKCLNDAGFFLDAKDVAGRNSLRTRYQSVFDMQDVRKTAHRACLDLRTHEEQWQCFFPQHIVRYIQTPLFVLNAAYDNWQIDNVLVPHSADTWHKWGFCQQDPIRCSDTQLKTLNGFRVAMLHHLKPLLNSPQGGVFLPSCFIHCQSMYFTTWHGPMVPRINNKTMAESVGDWFFDRRLVRDIDDPYPSNPTCFDWRHPANS